MTPSAFLYEDDLPYWGVPEWIAFRIHKLLVACALPISHSAEQHPINGYISLI